MKSPAPLFDRNDILDRIAGRRHDVLIIGGGINGAGLARDLALRGLSVVLAEQGDFASGTSSASTKLIHGGLRYLKNLDFRLVLESCRERAILQRIAPHLVQPIPFLIPVYRGDPHTLFEVRAGLTVYELLAAFRIPRRHRILTARRTLAQEPELAPEGLRGAAVYWDCRMDDARLCLENVMAAAQSGGMTVNYLQATGLLKAGGKVKGARLRDRETGAELEVEAAVVVNAGGPWLDMICALDGDMERKLRPTRGSHILVPRLNRQEEALYLTAGRDDRLFFVIPWGDLSLIGTTDLDHDGDPVGEPTEEEIGYLLAETARHLQGTGLGRQDVVAAFSGVRPLIAKKGAASRISREHRLFASASGLISIGGGKYTTYRAVAAEAAALVCARLGRGGGPSRTGRIPLPGGNIPDFAAFLTTQREELTRHYGLEPSQADLLVARYGSRISQVMALLTREPSLIGPVVAGSPLLAVEVVWMLEEEFARTPEDVLRRRTPLALQRGCGTAELPAVRTIIGERLAGGSPGRHFYSMKG